MRLLHAQLGLTVALAALTGCEREASAPVSVPTSTPSAPAAPAAPVAPASGDIPSSSAPAGPSEGATAIGGVTGGKQDGGATRGGAPEATGGDGTSAPDDKSKGK